MENSKIETPSNTFPVFSIKDQEAWNDLLKEADSNSISLLSISARFANLVEKRIAEGETLENIAKTTGESTIGYDDLSDRVIIRSSKVALILGILKKVWKYGEEFVRLYTLPIDKANKEAEDFQEEQIRRLSKM